MHEPKKVEIRYETEPAELAMLAENLKKCTVSVSLHDVRLTFTNRHHVPPNNIEHAAQSGEAPVQQDDKSEPPDITPCIYAECGYPGVIGGMKCKSKHCSNYSA